MSIDFVVGQLVYGRLAEPSAITRVYAKTIRVSPHPGMAISKKTLESEDRYYRYFLTKEEAMEFRLLNQEWGDFRQRIPYALPDITREQLADIREQFGMKAPT